MPKVLIVGDANVDILVHYPTVTREQSTAVHFENPSLQGGGTAANTATALARLNVPTAFIGTIGDDSYGRYVQEDFRKSGIDTTGLIVDPTRNTVGVFAFIDNQGERYLWGWPREKRSFKVLDPEKVNDNQVLQADWVHSSGMTLTYDTSARSTIIAIFKLAYEHNIPTSFDLNLRVDNGRLDPSYEQAVKEILTYTTYVLGSGEEEYVYLGDGQDWLANARALVTNDRTIIIRNGSQGSLALTPDRQIAVPAFEVTVDDTVGAGDVYNAGFIKALLQHQGLREALRLGNAVSGYTVTKPGSRACPTQAQLEAFLEDHVLTES